MKTASARPRATSSLTLTLICFFLGNQLLKADISYTVTVNTSPLMGHVAAPFSLDFQINDGSGTGDANNSIKIVGVKNFGGSIGGTPVLTGGASGSLLSSVTLQDSAFFNDFQQSFTPGRKLRFRVVMTTNVDSGATPDAFSFSIVDNTSASIPTVGLGNTLLLVNIDSAAPGIFTFAGDTSTKPAGGGQPIAIA